ncbi:unnamed protein product [Macrosiphum euphorbiae]|uniref:Uncharacterized protein n=1 Tax=Macrosiphum euphorbiae TaxID=13131 RepID=A0AAV0VUT9_9HEMI|nr:unnamed protein product [Macrosiphum euphorbiae]
MLCTNAERRQIETVERQKEMLDIGGVEDHLDDVPPSTPKKIQHRRTTITARVKTSLIDRRDQKGARSLVSPGLSGFILKYIWCNSTWAVQLTT